MPTLQRVLIANRGEIAVRIAAAASALGLESVSLHAAADSQSLHTRVTTTSVEIGAGLDAVAAYLDIEGVIEAALASGCDSVHPGYGFLAENAAFAQRCVDAGLVFVGPTPEAIALFGDKLAARQLAVSLGIPVVPGVASPLESLQEAELAAGELGVPLMLKAAAGGGGRGMRVVNSLAELPEAFQRCQSEARAAFGNDAVFAERMVVRPRHIEVQILADATGATVHLWERDCSVQARHQKVIEIAPAPGLDDSLRQRMLADAVRLVSSCGYRNAGTVEFLVEPESGAHYFIECNPRIQVEHTVTEEVTGIDLVEAQFRLAAGQTLADLGIARQVDVPSPSGFAVQARVVATGSGTFVSYKEPSGRGIRVDSAGYAGYTPPTFFDPLFAKVITRSNSTGTLQSALARADRALADFHVEGLPTNLAVLRAIVTSDEVQAGNARTTLLADRPDLAMATSVESTPVRMLLGAAAGSPTGSEPPTRSTSTLTVLEGQVGIGSPMDATVLETRVGLGAIVTVGDVLMIVNAMKMETEVTATCDGVVAGLHDGSPGDPVVAGELLVVIVPALERAEGDRSTAPAASSPWHETLDEVQALRDLADARLAADSDEPGVVRQRDRGKLHCRARIDLLLDEGTFHEVGSLAGFPSYDEHGAVSDFTPANHVGGWGDIDHRQAIVCADDFTSRGGHSDGAIGAKSFYLDRLSIELRVPSVRLLDGSSGGGSVASMVPQQKAEGESGAKESSGAITAGRPRVSGSGGSFLPGHLGSTEYTEQLQTVPVVNLLLGSVVGLGAAKAVLGHFSVMVRDIAQLFVAGPPVVSHAMGYDISKEDLGDWRIHCTNGSVDNVAETEAEAMEMARRFLSYLPPSVYDAPPVLPGRADDPADRREEELLHIIPRKRTTTFDMRRAIELMADRESFFEIGPLWGSDQITGFVRFNGFPLGVIASDSRHVNGGALTADGCDKLTRHLDLCSLFHIPVLNLIDNPGFAVGVEHERASTIRKGGRWMVAFAQTDVPIFSVLMRRSFGVAGNNYATPQNRPSVRVTWPAADTGGIPPEGGIEAAYKRQLAEAADPVALRAELNARIESARGPVGPLSRFQIEEMIDPRATRGLISAWAATAHRITSHPDRLAARPLPFRP